MKANQPLGGKANMKVRNQLLAVAAAVLFAVALALTIMVVSMSVVRTSVKDTADAPQTQEAQLVNAAPDPPESETETAPETEPETPAESLLFESLGNGTCAVAGMGGLTDACVIIPEASPAGERVVRIASRAFYGCERVTAVQIPATVREIGSMAFADCPNLVYLSVSAANAYFCDVDGVLFTADRRVLIQYPTMRAGNPAVIPASVSTICEMAFYRCVNLKTVRYEGAAEDWDRIAIAPRNYGLIAAAVEFAGDPTP